MTRDFFDPSPEQQNVTLIDPATLAEPNDGLQSGNRREFEGGSIRWADDQLGNSSSGARLP